MRRLNKHVAAFAADCAFDLGGRKLKLDSLWVNILKPGGTHSGHIHPHSAVSGTIYVTVPPGSGALRFEDPRLPLMMAAPSRPDTFVAYVEPAAGSVFLWESWLRHEADAQMRRKGRADQHQLQLSKLNRLSSTRPYDWVRPSMTAAIC